MTFVMGACGHDKDGGYCADCFDKSKKQARFEVLEEVKKAAENVKSIKFSGWTPKHKYGREEASDEILKEIRALKEKNNG